MTVTCAKCGQELRLPLGSRAAKYRCPRCKGEFRFLSRRPALRQVITLGAIGLAVIATLYRPLDRALGPRVESPHDLSARLINANVGKTDSKLEEEYQKVNARHFGGALPKMNINYESGVEALAASRHKDLHIEGIFLHQRGQSMILLHPKLMNDRQSRMRTLCHEMAHVLLFTRGDTTTEHGPPFQEVVRRLSNEGAFVGVFASETDKETLRTWLDEKKPELEELEQKIDSNRGSADALENQVEALNDRIRDANARSYGWPTDEEIESVEASLQERVYALNSLVRDYNAGAKEFNKNVKRYNLMLVYPDGLDEERMYRVKEPRELHSSQNSSGALSRSRK